MNWWSHNRKLRELNMKSDGWVHSCGCCWSVVEVCGVAAYCMFSRHIVKYVCVCEIHQPAMALATCTVAWLLSCNTRRSDLCVSPSIVTCASHQWQRVPFWECPVLCCSKELVAFSRKSQRYWHVSCAYFEYMQSGDCKQIDSFGKQCVFTWLFLQLI